MLNAQIENYTFGAVMIGGATYVDDVLVLDGRVKGGPEKKRGLR